MTTSNKTKLRLDSNNNNGSDYGPVAQHSTRRPLSSIISVDQSSSLKRDQSFRKSIVSIFLFIYLIILISNNTNILCLFQASMHNDQSSIRGIYNVFYISQLIY